MNKQFKRINIFYIFSLFCMGGLSSNAMKKAENWRPMGGMTAPKKEADSRFKCFVKDYLGERGWSIFSWYLKGVLCFFLIFCSLRLLGYPLKCLGYIYIALGFCFGGLVGFFFLFPDPIATLLFAFFLLFLLPMAVGYVIEKVWAFAYDFFAMDRWI